ALDLRRSHNRESNFASLGQSVYRGSSQELRSRELAGRNGRDAKRKWLGVAPICTFHGLAVPTTSVRKQENHPGLERSLQVCRKLRRKPLTQRPKFIPHFWHSRRHFTRWGSCPGGTLDPRACPQALDPGVTSLLPMTGSRVSSTFPPFTRLPCTRMGNASTAADPADRSVGATAEGAMLRWIASPVLGSLCLLATVLGFMTWAVDGATAATLPSGVFSDQADEESAD